MLFYGLIAILLFCISPCFAQKKTKIACVGNSITYGATIENRINYSYPAQLASLLGEGYEVRNYGKNSATLLKKGNLPYISTQEYEQTLEFMPDWVFIKLGTNDSKPDNRVFLSDFIEDYKQLIRSFTQLSSHPRIVLLLPLPAFCVGDKGITADVIEKEIIPQIRELAFETGIEIIDLHQIFIDSLTLFTDGIHPSASGATRIAKYLYDYITTPRETKFQLTIQLPNEATSFNFYGFHGYTFEFNGRQAKVVIPKYTAKDKPWIWRARFWGHEPQVDIALLERGFHLVYCDVSELFGNEEALNLWDRFYLFLTQAGLAPKSVMEGLSRGGFYLYRWVAKYPQRVQAIYADAPVLDIKSWPGGQGTGKGSPQDWEIFKTDFQLKDDKSALTFKGNPVNLTREIIRANCPILHVVGDADDIVPVSENTALFEKKMKKRNHPIRVIHKKGIGHHPHSLQNPQPIVEFILKAYTEKK